MVRYLADRVVVMYLGHILEMGSTEQIFTPPFHPYTEALLSAIPIADLSVKKRHVVLEGEIPSALSPPSGCPFQTRCGHKRDVAGRSMRAGDAADANRRRRPYDQVPSAQRGARTHGAGIRMTRRLSLEEATGLAVRAARAAGLSDEAALSLARATVSANAHGKSSSGFSHLMDYLAAARAGRIDGARRARS